jgi:hypothetical protein
MRRERARLATLLPLLALPLLGCGDEPLGIEDGARKPTSVEPSLGFQELTLDPFHPAVEAGGSIRLTACWRSSSGTYVWPVTSPWKVTWVTEHPEIAEVTEDGLVNARSRGLAIIRVTVTYTTSGQWGQTYAYSGSTPVGVR